MTDASPVNRYLLFTGTNEHTTSDKLNYALHHGPAYRSIWPHADSKEYHGIPIDMKTDRQLIRTQDELKRICGDRGTITTPSTGPTAPLGFTSAYSSSEAYQVPQLGNSADTSPLFQDEAEEIDGKPWDRTAVQTDLWNWPMEVLYQSYNLSIVIDFGQATFNLSRNGEVIVDRIPSVVAALLNVIETTLSARVQDVEAMVAWLLANVPDGETRSLLLRRVWNPTIYVSVILINAPKRAIEAIHFTEAQRSARGASHSRPTREGDVSFFHSDVPRFTAFHALGDTAYQTRTGITLLSRCDAREIVRDKTFIERFQELLIRCESTCRESAGEEWPESNLSASLEYLVRTSPESSGECYTMVLVTNTHAMSCTDTLSFFEGLVRRKNLILSLVALNRLVSFDSPQMSPLSQFLSEVGGFAVHIDYWLALATPRLNSDWCHRFEGARCLAQQFFVQLVNHFPVCCHGIAEWYRASDTSNDSVVLYDSARELPVFANKTTVWAILKSIAVARFNEGWRVLIDYKDEVSPGFLVARYRHNFNKGTLTLHYEMDVTESVVQRRLHVSGTKTLVDHFLRLRPDEPVLSALSEANGSWLAYLTLLRVQVHQWIRAEQVLVCILCASPRLGCPVPAVPELGVLSSFEGVMSEWADIADVTAFAIFFGYEGIAPSLLWSISKSPNSAVSAAMSAVATGKALLRTVLLKEHHAVGKEDDLTFLRVDGSGCPQYVLQLIPFHEATRPAEAGLAGGFECRVSFLLCESSARLLTIQQLAESMKTAVADRRSSGHGLVDPIFQRECHFQISAAPSLQNSQALLLVVATVSPRRMEFMSLFYDSATQLGSHASSHISHRSERRLGVWHANAAPQKYALCDLLKAMRMPYVPFSWLLSTAISHQWSFTFPEASPQLASDAFNYMILQRQHQGFRLLFCHMGSLKAVLHNERNLQGGVMSSFDVLEVHPASAVAEQRVSICRLLTPYMHPAATSRAVVEDAEEDLHIATALQSYRTFSAIQNALDDRRTAVGGRDVQHRDSTVVTAHVESLLPYLRASHLRMISFNTPQSLGESCVVELRRRLIELMGAMGDHTVQVDARLLCPKVVSLIARTPGVDPTFPGSKVAVTAFYPVRYQTIVFLLALVEDTPKGLSNLAVAIGMAFMDAPLLHSGLTTRLGNASGLAKGQSKFHRLVDSAKDHSMIRSLTHMLTSFTNIFLTKQLLEAVSITVPSPESDEREEQYFDDLSAAMSGLMTTGAQVDITHLWRVMTSRYRGELAVEALERVVNGIVMRQVRLPFASQPTLLIPLLANDDVDGSDTRDDTAILQVLPILMKMCVQLTWEEGDAARSTTRWVSKSCSEDLIQDGAIWSPKSPAKDGPDLPRPWQQAQLRLFVKTAEPVMLGLYRDAQCTVTPGAARAVLRELIYQYNSMEAPSGLSQLSLAVPTNVLSEGPLLRRLFHTNERHDGAACDELLAQSWRFDAFPESFETALSALSSSLARAIAVYTLRSTFLSTTFQDLRKVVCGVRSTPVHAEEDTNLLYLVHADPSVCQRAQSLPGMAYLAESVVAPALLSSPAFRSEVFPVAFTQQSTAYLSVDPIEAAVDVFHRCVDEDHMCVVRAGEFAYLFVPNDSFFDTRWVMVRLDVHASHTAGQQNNASILCYEGEDAAPRTELRAFIKQLRSHIYDKVMQISQLNLLKQLRDTQNASAELIPVHWGEQFLATTKSPSAPVSTRPPGPDGPSSSPFYLRGETVLEIPIYYKLQHQCRKILSRIGTNCSRLELIHIFNREQCFVVADDVEGDTFHYIRLVFVKDLTRGVSVYEPPPPILASDRCPELVIQLFTATTNPSVKRPLQKLQDFCYFLAVQELQGQLTYMQHHMISFNDLIFLQNCRLDPILVDLADLPGTVTVEDTQLAFSLLFLNLRENKFKLFNVQCDDYSHTTSNFVDHYNLEEGPKQSAAIPTKKTLGEKAQVLRCVKIVDGLTDVLVSCALQMDKRNDNVITVERYLTKIPAERYINGESEQAILSELAGHVHDVVVQVSFHALSRDRSFLPPLSVPLLVKDLMALKADASCYSSMLRDHTFPLDDVSPAVFPHLLERLCGTLSLYAPRCFEGRREQPTTLKAISSFSWQWKERMQKDPLIDQMEFYMTCGYNVCAEHEEPMPATRVVPVLLLQLPLTLSTVDEAQASVLREHRLGIPTPLESRIVVRVCLTEGIRILLFNLRDAETVLQLFSTAIEAAEEKSALLCDVLMQRLGYVTQGPVAEGVLAQHCCGDSTNVLKSKPLAISGDVYRRRVNYVRYRPHQDDPKDVIAVVVEGLYNRGLIVNFCFATEDAVKVIYDEYSDKSLQDCETIVLELLRHGVLEDADSFSFLKPQLPFRSTTPSGKGDSHFPVNCRLVESGGVPADALIACDYQRHVVAAHIIVEAQNARSEVAEVLARCDALWRAGPQNNVLEVARSVVTLQMKSKQVFGSRVPDFILRPENWSPEDDVLDPTLPSLEEQDPGYTQGVDRALLSYMEHIRRMYPSMCMIDLDPNDPTTTTDPVLLSRLRCRYGKATSESGIVRFSPHLYYAAIPFVDLLRCEGMCERYRTVLAMLEEEAQASPITSSGLFIVEVGLQVVHYALDFFVISGAAVPHSITAQVAAEFKQSLNFDGLLYDATVRHLMQCFRHYVPALPGLQEPATAVAHMVKHYPSAPVHSVNIAAVYSITDPRVMRLKNLSTNVPGRYRVKDAVYLHPEANKTLIRDATGGAYSYCGFILWDTAQLFVLLAIAKPASRGTRHPNPNLQAVVSRAKRRLLNQLLYSTLQERLDAAYEKFLTYSSDELPVYDEFDFLRNHSHKIELQGYRRLLQQSLRHVEWSGDSTNLLRVCRQLCPQHVMRVLWKASRTDQSLQTSNTETRLFNWQTSIGGINPAALFTSNVVTGRLVVTFASNHISGQVFLAMECWSIADADTPFVVEDVSLYRKTPGTTHSQPLVVLITEEERQMIELFVLVAVNTLWTAIMPCSSQALA